MGYSAFKIGCVAYGVIGVILVTVCCALPSWVVVSIPNRPGTAPQVIHYGLWKVCVRETVQICTNYPILTAFLQATRAMTVMSCLLTYICVLILIFLTLGLCPNHITFLQNEDAKPKVRLAVGVGLLLAGLLVIISVSSFPNLVGIGSRGAGIFVGGAAGVLLASGGSFLCHFRMRDFP